MDTTTRPVVAHDAVIPPWDQLTQAQRFRYAGNLDPWAGPVDPVAAERAAARTPRPGTREELAENTCGCWSLDCAECGARAADGQRPPKGHRRAWALRQDAAHQQARQAAR